jgi:hypothetical protein
VYNFIGPHLFQSMFGMPLLRYSYTIPPWMVRHHDHSLTSNDQVRRFPGPGSPSRALPITSILQVSLEIKLELIDLHPELVSIQL